MRKCVPIQWIPVCSAEGEAPIEICAEDDGTLLLKSITNHFPGTTTLKYRNAATDSYRGVKCQDGVLYPPSKDYGWKGPNLYVCVNPEKKQPESCEQTAVLPVTQDSTVEQKPVLLNTKNSILEQKPSTVEHPESYLTQNPSTAEHQESILEQAILDILPNKKKVEVWRVNSSNLKLEHVPYEDQGVFWNGDSYLIYDSTRHVIYYWIGNDSSEKERKAAANEASQFSNYLGSATLERLSEGKEGEDFKSLFEEMTIYMNSIDYGLNTKEHQTKLYRAVGKTYTVYTEVKIGWENMNHGDVFVLDCRPIIFVWKGKSSTLNEQLAGNVFASVKKDKLHKQVVVVKDGEEREMNYREKEVWERYLPLDSKASVKEACPRDDETFDRKVEEEFSLYQCSDDTGDYQWTRLKAGMLEKSDLKSDDVFLVNAKALGVWVWQGKQSSKLEKNMTMQYGEKFIQGSKYPPHTRLVKVIEGAECPEFRSLFSKW